MAFPVLGSTSPEAIELGRLVHPRDGISNKIRYGGERHVLVFGDERLRQGNANPAP